MIEIKNIGLKIGQTEILHDISLCFERGNIYGIVGRNGSGKTMLMKIISGFIKATQGEVIIDEKIIGKDIDFPQNMGLIIETPGFIPYYSGYHNLKLLADIQGKARKKEIEEVMQLTGLGQYKKRKVRKYSLGMKQRLGIAQALMENPDILILDEPFNGLDQEGVEQMREVFLNIKQDKIIILSSHNTQDIEILCDYVYEMQKGKIRMK